MALLVAAKEYQPLQKAFSDMCEAETTALISSLDEDTVTKLYGAVLPADVPCRRVLSKELAQRLASRLDQERLNRLWQLLRAHPDDDRDSWVQAASCLLCGHIDRLEVLLEHLSTKMLTEAVQFLEDQAAAVAFAKHFFKCDIGISAVEQWPRKSTAPMFQELSHRLADENFDERLRVLVHGHQIDESHQGIKEALSKQLHDHLLRQPASTGSDMEGLFLKVAVRNGVDISRDLLAKLTLKPCHLSEAQPEQLMILAQHLGRYDLQTDAAKVAAFAARAFGSSGHARDCADAYLTAFAMDHCNRDAAQGVAQALSSAHRRCDMLEADCKELKEKWKMPRLDLGCPVVWDLRVSRQSQVFLLPGGVVAWLDVWPEAGRLDLRLEGKANVKGTVQVDSCKPSNFEVKPKFCKLLVDSAYCKTITIFPPTLLPSCITLRVQSVERQGSALRFEGDHSTLESTPRRHETPVQVG